MFRMWDGSTSADPANFLRLTKRMQLSLEHSLTTPEYRIATAELGMDSSPFNRYLSDVRFSRVGSFARLAEWIGDGPVLLSMSKGFKS